MRGGQHELTADNRASSSKTALGNGSYLVVSEGQGHYQMSQNKCTGAVAAAYLIEPTKPPATTSCPSTFP